MKITLFIPSLIGCGAERVMVNLANYLCSAGYSVTVLNYRVNESFYRLDERIERRFLYDRPEKLNFFGKVFCYFFNRLYDRRVQAGRRRRLKRFIKRNDTDAYLVMLESATIDLLSLKKYVKAPVIVSERNYPENYREDIRSRLKDLARFADGFVFQTDAARKWYGESAVSGVVIPNAVNEEFADCEPNIRKREKTVINAGRLEKQKNQALLVGAFSKAKTDGHKLEIYGEGPLKEELQALIVSLGAEDKIFLKGYTNDIKSVMARASLFVLSSDYEGIPNVVLEAMAMGVPVITTDFAGGGAHTLIDDGVSGVIVGAGDEKELASAIERVLSDDDLALKLSNGAREKIKTFSAKTIYDKWDKYIKKVCDRG